MGKTDFTGPFSHFGIPLYTLLFTYVQFLGAFEHSMVLVLEIYALDNVVFYIVVYGSYKP